MSDQFQEPSQEVENSEGVSKDERTWAMLCHLSAFLGLIIPFGNIIAPLVIWLIKSEDMPFVKEQGKESLNLQITLYLAGIACGLLMFIGVGFVLAWILAVYAFIVIIIASVKVNEGVHYRYPVALRFIK